MRMGWHREAPRKLRFLKVGFPQAHTGWGLTGNFFGVIMRMGTGAPDIFDFYRKSFVQVSVNKFPGIRNYVAG